MKSSAGNKRRRSPSILNPSLSSTEQGNLVVDDIHMLDTRLSNPRKRQGSEYHSPQLNGTAQPLLKKRKLNRPHDEARSRTPAAFYDNLSKVWLTKHALRELDRRNAQPTPSSHCLSRRRNHKPFTRRALAELKNNHPSTQSAPDFICRSTSRCLKDIKRLARHGGPDLRDLRGVCIAKYLLASELTMSLQYPEPINPLVCAMSSIQSSSRDRGKGRALTFSSKTQTTATTPTTTIRNTRPHDPDFQQHLIDHGVYPHAYKYPDGRVPAKPTNWEEINQRLAQPRSSLSPSEFSEEAFEELVQTDAHASKENKVTDSVIPIIEGKIMDGRCIVGEIPLTNLDHLTDGTLSPGNPDVFHGARPEQLNRKIRNELWGHIVPSTQEDLPMAPNFFLATKGPDESLAVAGRQASYDGALGARGIQSLQSYGQSEPIYDNNAYTVTSIYHGGQLKMYTSHPSQPTGPENRPEYYMTQLNTWGMTGNLETCRQGVTAYRNARDWAKEKRDGFIEAANGRIPDTNTESPSLDSSGHGRASVSRAGPVLVDSETSADELALEEQTYTSFRKRPKKGPFRVGSGS
ncbi:hypothetical protein MMC14_010182 [Varicellaria rhodocarpa]|nr:hypothetical protein [Varicellaria rhodocarpa]